jgi:hypothetical protein
MPVFLKVVIRPSPQSTLLGLSFTTRPTWPHRDAERAEKELGLARNLLASIADANLSGLIDCVQEFYSLPDKPELILPLGSTNQ